MSVAGQRHRWYEPEIERERKRAALEKQATQLIRAADRRSREKQNGTAVVISPKSEPPASRNGWIKLGDLEHVLKGRTK
jgi:hypothetical protein